MSFDAREFRSALGAFTTGVTIVTTHSRDHGDVGLTANSFNSVSLEPPLVLWSLAKTAGSLNAFTQAEHFAVHILAQSQQSLSNQFAQRGIDKFADLPLDRGPDQTPLLHNCAARFLCKTSYQYEGGDHLIFVGEVIDFEHCDKPPLLFHDGKYGHIEKNSDTATDIPDESLGMLLRKSYQRLIKPLEHELEKKSLSLSQHYLLANVARHKSIDLKRCLMAMAETAPTDTEITQLVQRNLIAVSDGHVSLTEQGIGLRVELASIYKSLESDALHHFSDEKSQSLKILLNQFLDSLTA